MTRLPNRTLPSLIPTTRLVLTSAERSILQYNKPGPSGDLGGMAKCENWVIDNIQENNVLECDDPRIGLIVRYCTVGPEGYGSGGPNKRLRAALIPAFCRLFGVSTR